jgi:processive 1,2-diacylglycerol beta-glucosyltransferase
MSTQPREKILLLTGSLGDGHIQAARAIAEAAGFYRPDAEVVVIDYMEWTHPRLHAAGRFCYMQWVKSLPSLYGYLYRKTRGDNRWSALFKRIKAFRTYRMLELLRDVRPTKVVSTFPAAAAAMSFLRSAGWTDIPTVTVMTDYTDHSYWIHPHTDAYLVAAEHVRQALLRLRVPESRIAVTGIPVRQSFAQAYDRAQLQAKHGLDPSLPTVLVMGGGCGLIGKQLLTVLQKEEFPTPIQFVVVCGRNEKLQQSLEEEKPKLEAKGGHRLHVTGYVNYVHELMASADLIVTKPGGLTVAEALALGLPMLLYKPLPGQEQANAAYLVESGAAALAADAGDLAARLRQVLADTALLTRMRDQAQAMCRKQGALDALRAILETQKATAPVRDSRLLRYAEA